MADKDRPGLTCVLSHSEKYSQHICLPYALNMVKNQVAPRLLLGRHTCAALAGPSIFYLLDVPSSQPSVFGPFP